MTIDFTDPKARITEHFTVKDALTLHSWKRLATHVDGVDFTKIVILCEKLEEIRALLSCGMNVHCMFRSQDYNKSQGIHPLNDVHSMSLACDFDCSPHMTISEVHAILEPKLEELGIRMEQNTPTWVHVDLHPVVHARYFLA